MISMGIHLFIGSAFVEMNVPESEQGDALSMCLGVNEIKWGKI